MRSLTIENESVTALLDRVDARADHVRDLMEAASPEDLFALWTQLDVSAIYYDCALEGQVIGPEELRAAFDPRTVSDAASHLFYTELRNHKQSHDLVRKMASKRGLTFSLDTFDQFHTLFSTEKDGDVSSQFRTEIPLHRSYFHDINPPALLETNLEKLIAWMNDPTDWESMHPILWASRFHFHFMRIFPYLRTSGKVGRAVMNVALVKLGYLPAVVHATERQRYYDALRTNQQNLTSLIIDSEMSSLDAAIRFLKRSSTPF